MASSQSIFSASLMVIFLILHQYQCQFFAKNTKNVPRLGRRGSLNEVSEVIPSGVKNLLAFVRKFDEDANGCLEPEELMEIPIFKIALENQDFTPFEIVADIVEEYKSEVEGDLKDIVAKIIAATYIR